MRDLIQIRIFWDDNNTTTIAKAENPTPTFPPDKFANTSIKDESIPFQPNSTFGCRFDLPNKVTPKITLK